MRRLVVASLLMIAASSAFAADLFTIHVPIELTQIHPTLTHVRLRCELRGTHPISTRQETFAVKGYPTPIEFALTGGAYSGTAVVVFTTEDLGSLDPRLVNQSICQFSFRAADGSLWQPYDSSTGPVLGRQPGTPFRWQVVTPIP
jgi:hypothetical protein